LLPEGNCKHYYTMIVSHCSLTRPWHPSTHEPYFPNLKKPKFRLIFTSSITYSLKLTAHVLPQGADVVSPDNVLVQNPVIETIEAKEEEVHGVFNGVASTKSEDKTPVKKKKKEEEDSFENRFQLRNGREVTFLSLFPPFLK